MVAAASLVAIALTAAACGSSSGSSTATSSSGGNSSNNTAEINSILASATADGKWTGPTSSPTPPKGKRLFALLTTLASQSNQIVEANLQAATSKLGWSLTVYDGQGMTTRYATGLQEALTGNYNGVVMWGITSTLVRPQLAALRAANIPVVSMSNTVPPSATSVNYNVGYNPDIETKDLVAAATKDSNGKAKIAVLNDPEFGIVVERLGFLKADLPKYCPGCSIVATTNVQAVNLYTPTLVSQIKDLIQANPSITYIWCPYDDVAVSAVQALQQLGTGNKIQILTYGAYPQLLTDMANGAPILVDIGAPVGWMAIESIDTMNRIFTNSTNTINHSVTNGEAVKLINKTNIPTGTQGWTGDYDYQQKYFTLWGVG